MTAAYSPVYFDESMSRHFYETAQKLVQIPIEQHQTVLRVIKDFFCG